MKSSNYPKIDHPIVMIKRDDEIIFSTPDGEEIACLRVCTMEKDEKQPNGKYKIAPSKSFWLVFSPSEKAYDSGMQNSAAVYLE